jgi:trehalose 6-phosphate phosphatase
MNRSVALGARRTVLQPERDCVDTIVEITKLDGMILTSRPPPVPARGHRYCLFLDFDGTLVNFAATPAQVHPDQWLVSLLAETFSLLDGAIAIVSGRSIDSMDRLLEPLRLAIAGVHGYERRAADGRVYRPTPDAARMASLRDKFIHFVAQHPGLLLEEKSAGLAVHFRRVPHLAATVSDYLLANSALLGDDFEFLEGDAVMEIKPATHNKATAVEAFMQEAPFAGRLPIYIGDDNTDCDGFTAVLRHEGMAIAVGDRVSTPWRLQDPAAVRAWLVDFNHMCRQANELKAATP